MAAEQRRWTSQRAALPLLRPAWSCTRVRTMSACVLGCLLLLLSSSMLCTIVIKRL